MVSLFGPIKVSPERKMSQVKQRSTRRLILPFFIGSLIVGGASATIQSAAGNIDWAEALGIAGIGGLSASFVVASGNQSGTSESSREILLAADRMAEAAEGLGESMTTTYERLDAQTAKLAETGQTMARLQANLKISDETIRQFSQGLYNMTQSGGFAPTQSTDQAYEVVPQQTSEPEKKELEFPLEETDTSYKEDGWY